MINVVIGIGIGLMLGAVLVLRRVLLMPPLPRSVRRGWKPNPEEREGPPPVR